LRRSGTINLNKTEDEIKENTKLDIPLIAAASIAPAIALAVTLASTRTAIPGLLS